MIFVAATDRRTHPVLIGATVVRAFSTDTRVQPVQRPLFVLVPSVPGRGPQFAPLTTFLPTDVGRAFLPGAGLVTAFLPVLDRVPVWLPGAANVPVYLPNERVYSFLPGDPLWVVFLDETAPFVVWSLDIGSTIVLNAPASSVTHLPGAPALTLFLR